ncbi:transferrin-binding protein-like solute binding protein [Roseinatronobacter alkalisoli]|uniref:Transferrin-binding protein-like solute binding protein n=1 Tax=Roseinatronobacter alkalisoli TaxID=3028235 RepID=A0ABT5TDF8_9RHOB|nr:transferrin-binding protein-like solute binding protein [Roseinatronobacter sp. HJB301]MDD7973148.1 transferrin-binding protein-like solute binding protein [Roseinatronobacter sp. HJB301]
MLRIFAVSCLAITALTACGDDGGMGMAPQSHTNVMTSGPGNTLVQSGQGNSGGVLARDGQDPVAGVEATMVYNAAGRGSGARVDFHNGPMVGVSVQCNRAGGGATVPECTAINAESAYLVNELSGVLSYAGAFAVNGYGPNQDQNGFAAIHAGPGTTATVNLPGTAVNYTGQFQSGASMISGGNRFAGRANGSTVLDADFAAGRLSGQFTGTLRDDATGLTTALNAGFDNAAIDPNARFFNTEDTSFTYGGQQAWGELDGAFYGPNAEEAAGAFGFGNQLGGMSGVMIGCSEYRGIDCIAPTPRF